jgi:hypothetical protein
VVIIIRITRSVKYLRGVLGEVTDLGEGKWFTKNVSLFEACSEFRLCKGSPLPFCTAEVQAVYLIVRLVILRIKVFKLKNSSREVMRVLNSQVPRH